MNLFNLDKKVALITGGNGGIGYAMAKAMGDAGANIIIYANHMLRAAYPGMVKVAKSILEKGCSASMEKNMLSIKEILEISGGI